MAMLTAKEILSIIPNVKMDDVFFNAMSGPIWSTWQAIDGEVAR